MTPQNDWLTHSKRRWDIALDLLLLTSTSLAYGALLGWIFYG